MKLAVFLASILLVVSAAVADISPVESDVVLARNYGGTTYAILSNVVNQIAANPRTLVIDGGTWTISDDLTLSSNICLYVARDSLLSINAGKTLTVRGWIASGDWPIFGGSGIATGPCENIFSEANWSANPEYLAPPFDLAVTNAVWSDMTSHVATVLVPYATTNWVTNYLTGELAPYATTNWVTNYVAITDAAQTTTITNWVTNLLTDYVSEEGGTATVSTIIFTNYPGLLNAYSIQTGNVYSSATTYNNITNWIPVIDQGVIGTWGSEYSTFLPTKRGVYEARCGFGVRVAGGIDRVRILLMKNGTNTVESVLDDRDCTGFAAESWYLNGASHFVATVPLTNFWQVREYHEGSGNVTNDTAKLFWIYHGDNQLIQ